MYFLIPDLHVLGLKKNLHVLVSFSDLKEKLNDLAMIALESDMLKKINYESII